MKGSNVAKQSEEGTLLNARTLTFCSDRSTPAVDPNPCLRGNLDRRLRLEMGM
jgi:hypothetical protein